MNDKKKIRIALKTAFNNTTQPPKLTYLFPHAPSLLLITFNIGSHVANFRGLAPTGKPKYLNGIEPL
jgi:hypothetical protein